MPTYSNQASSTVLHPGGQNAAENSGTVVIMVFRRCADGVSWQAAVEIDM